jgi:AraC-like DNA-binding protein
MATTSVNSAALRLDDNERELIDLISRWPASDGGHATTIPQLKLWRFSAPTEPAYAIQEAAVYFVVQGRKQVTVGGDMYIYDASQYLAVSVDLPVLSNVLQASAAKPYLCMTLSVDARELAALIVETGLHPRRADHDPRALFVSPLEPALRETLLRLARLLDAPEDAPILAPLIIRELHYRLLKGDQFSRLAGIAIGGGALRRVSGAITWIREHFNEPLQIGALANRVHMSPSALHQHFKAATEMSPLQYQKRLRLNEARRLLLTGGSSAEAAAYAVGYASASQFSREYARLYGEPPGRDADRLREELVHSTAYDLSGTKPKP